MKKLMYSKRKTVYVKDTWHNDKIPLDIILTVEQIYHNNEKVRYNFNEIFKPLFNLTRINFYLLIY